MIKVSNSKIELLIFLIFGTVISIIGILEDITKAIYGVVALCIIYILVCKEIIYDNDCLIIKFKYNFLIKDKHFNWQDIRGLKTGAEGLVYLELSNGENYKFTSIGFNASELEKIFESKTLQKE